MSDKEKLKIGVIGAGHLGKIHIKILSTHEDYFLQGIYDSSEDTLATVAKEFSTKAFASAEDLLHECDVIDIVTPTISHYEYCMKAIGLGKHFFVEKPIAFSLDEARAIVSAAGEKGVIGQVGHVERFNAAWLASKKYAGSPMFIEAHRLAEFKPRGIDVSVILDLMIHDIDIVLSLIKAPVSNIHASGVAVVSDTIDIANARIEFDNGCVANLTASRVSIKNERKMRLFQSDTYLSVNMQTGESNIIQLMDAENADADCVIIEPGEGIRPRALKFISPEPPVINAISHELALLAQSIHNSSPAAVSLEDGFRNLEIATEILRQIEITRHKADSYNSTII